MRILQLPPPLTRYMSYAYLDLKKQKNKTNKKQTNKQTKNPDKNPNTHKNANINQYYYRKQCIWPYPVAHPTGVQLKENCHRALTYLMAK